MRESIYINYSVACIRNDGMPLLPSIACINRLHGVGHLGDDEAMEAGGREFDPRPGHYSRMSF